MNLVSSITGHGQPNHTPGVSAAPADEFSLTTQSQAVTTPQTTDATAQPFTGFAWSTSTILITTWITGLVLLSMRWLVGVFQVRNLVRKSQPASDWINEQADHLCRELKVRRCPALQTPIDGSPCLCMTFGGPVILIPQSIASTADRSEITAILMHELSHLRSGDLGWNRLLRIVTGLLWPHPLAWRIGSAHLQACEDAADAESTCRLGETEIYSRTLAKVALSVTAGKRPVGLAMARVSDVRRRLDRVKQTFQLLPLTRRQITATIVSASFVFLMLGTFRFVYAQPPVDAKPNDDAVEIAVDDDAERSLTVRIGDEQGKPISGVEFNAWYNSKKISPEPTDDGVYKITFPSDARFLSLKAKAPQRNPHVATWREDELKTELGETFEFRMPVGTTISGHVLDEAGSPIKDATVSVLDASGVKDSSRPQARVYKHDVQTDSEGRWVCDVMPKEFSQVWLKLTHPDYISDSTFGETAGQVSVDEVRSGTHRMVMKQGITVKGKIVDTSGNPIKGATIFQGSDRFGSDYPRTTSDAAGEFEFKQRKLGQLILTIVADKFAPELKEIDVTADTGVIAIELLPGNPFRLRTVDAAGNPLPGVWIVPDTWRGHRSLVDASIPQKSNKQGIYQWDNGPVDEIAFDMLAEGFLDKRQYKLSASDEEQVVTFIRPLMVSGKVVDATTKQPIEEFEVIQGMQFEGSDWINWERQSSKLGSAGTFQSTFGFPRPGHLLRIEAKGYAPMDSRVLRSDEGEVSLSFELEPSAPLKGVVTLDGGLPAAGAQVVVALTGQYDVRIVNGRLSDARDELMVTTDEQGRFELPSQSDAFRLMFLHPFGGKLIAGEAFTTGQTVKIEPWATISGTVRIGSEPASETDVALHHTDSVPYDQTRFRIEGRATTDNEGRFVLKRVLPGESFSMQRVIPRKTQGELFSHTVRLTTEPGGDHEVRIGGDGRPVIGRVFVPDTDAKYDWGTNLIMPDSSKFKYPDAVDKLTNEEKQKWYAQWSETDEGIAYTNKQNRLYAVVIRDDGTFRVDDVPADDYTLSLSIHAATATNQCGFGESLGSVVHHFPVPEMPSGRSDEPLDVGELTLKLRQFVNVGDPAPAFTAKTFDNESIELSDYAGKYVLLDFWATWCGPCLAEMPNLQKVYEKHQDDERLVIISLSMDAEAETANEYVTENPMPWTPVHVGDSSDASSDYGIQSIPATFLIDPDGKVIAKDIRGDALINMINETLGPATTSEGNRARGE
ncbi:Thiol-disulfide oxidoreductase ResA [Rubripirellula tenax]|uniref:Thiol-disulfide oxidoreductase ResA n=1 Tax=Rubripirellula tenax TaxID=2528015 RepID=A0A5C6EIR9_9BACT|nr:carboxypeptidase regulatory-like domain-containing protein [Rubripirellula tenax]TWU47159.1 Thiol-disulfide oxidoreductase ResA [Rubripirellula tenax]